MMVSQQQQQSQPLPSMYYHPQQQVQQQQQQQQIQIVQVQQVQHLVPSGSTTIREQVSTKEMHKPKGRMSAYTFFVQKCRDEHRKANPNENANFSEFSKKCAEKWKTMTESEKSKFAAQAEIDKQRFEREMAAYQPGEKRGKKRKKDPLAPKRPLSAFFHYCKEERPKLKALNPSLSVGDIAKELGERWNHTAPGDKLIYEEAAQRDKERYEKEMTEFKLANKKGLKQQPSQLQTQQTSTPIQQVSVVQHNSQLQTNQHLSEQQQQQQQHIRIRQEQQQQYSNPTYQLSSYNPIQTTYPPQNYTSMNNYQDNVLANSNFSHYNGYSLPMQHNNIQMQNYSTLQQQTPTTHIQHQTYQTLTPVNNNHYGYDDDENFIGNDDDDDNQDDSNGDE